MKYVAKIDNENQIFVVEDQSGNLVATRQMPHRRSPNPGQDVLMEHEFNSNAWKRIQELVENANKAESI